MKFEKNETERSGAVRKGAEWCSGERNFRYSERSIGHGNLISCRASALPKGSGTARRGATGGTSSTALHCPEAECLSASHRLSLSVCSPFFRPSTPASPLTRRGCAPNTVLSCRQSITRAANVVAERNSRNSCHIPFATAQWPFRNARSIRRVYE